jgi:hypothetical protein
LRKRGKSLHKVVAALRVKFRKGVVEEEEGWLAVICGEQFNLGKEEREEEAALLAARRDQGEIFFVGAEGEVVAVWADKCVPLVALALRSFFKRSAQPGGGRVSIFVHAVPFPRDVVHG